MDNTNTYEEEWILELLKLVQKEFNSVNEIARLTKELGDAASRDDRVTMQMLLEMRKAEMDTVDGYEKKIVMMEENAPEELKKGLISILKGVPCEELKIKGADQVASIVRSNKKTIDQAIAIDKVISVRLAGKESFYTNK